LKVKGAYAFKEIVVHQPIIQMYWYIYLKIKLC